MAHLKDEKHIKLMVLAGEAVRRIPTAAQGARHREARGGEAQRGGHRELHRRSDAGIYASERESFGMGVLETMSFGKPVVATRVGGVSEIVVDGETGYLKRLGDVRSLAAAVRKLAKRSGVVRATGRGGEGSGAGPLFGRGERGQVRCLLSSRDGRMPRLTQNH